MLSVGFAVVASSLLYALYTIARFLRETLRVLWTPLRQLKGPPNPSWLTGVEGMMLVAEDDTLIGKWVEDFGLSFRYPTFAARSGLCTIDPRAMAHVMNTPDIYYKPEVIRNILGQYLGDGLVIAEGERHKRQRRILNPSFSSAQLREITPIFFEKALQLRDIWHDMLHRAPENTQEIDTYLWLGRATLDMIGLAGFGYTFDALLNDNNELAIATKELFRLQLQVRAENMLRAWFPILRLVIPDKDGEMKRKSMDTMHRIGFELVREKKLEALGTPQGEDSKAQNTSGVSSLKGRDLLSALLRANMAVDLAPAQRLDDEEVMNQITTFLLAGHETTTSGMAWALHVLSQHMDVQTKLRAELLSVIDEAPSMNDLNGLQYLDLFVREVLRLYAPVRDTVRQATRDDTIPLSSPIVDAKGNMLDSVRVHAGDTVLVPIIAMNVSELLWGQDAHEFRPERFKELPEGATAITGVWSHTMTFIGGPRACIGYRFSVLEMKAMLFTLVRSFTFEPAGLSLTIQKKTAIVTRPVVKGKEDEGAQLPLRVSLASKIL